MMFGPGFGSAQSTDQREINKLKEMRLNSALPKQYVMYARECIWICT